MSKVNSGFKGRLTNEKRDTVTSSIVIFEQDNNTIIFSPTLELYAYNLEEFINYTMNKGIFKTELKRMGWEFKKRKKQYIVPSFSKMLNRNEKLVDILDNNNASIKREVFTLLLG
ncbi:MAG: hypothetical protein L3J06_00950 [Cyclobacteriaceae bacterium]|nr:hypothetical protein [Cyclobacteriaceae bacterium]